MHVAGVVATQEKLEKGWRLVVNDGENARKLCGVKVRPNCVSSTLACPRREKDGMAAWMMMIYNLNGMISGFLSGSRLND